MEPHNCAVLPSPHKVKPFDKIFLQKQLLNGTLFRVSVWWENGSLYEVQDVEGTEIELEVFGEAVTGARVSLQVIIIITTIFHFLNTLKP